MRTAKAAMFVGFLVVSAACNADALSAADGAELRDANRFIDDLGLESFDAAPDFDPVSDGGVLPSGVAQGPCHGCAWSKGRAFCWGANNFGALGDGSRQSRSVAMPVSGITDVVLLAVGCGNPDTSGHSCALTSIGEVWCWGANGDGQLGDQSATDQLTPVRIRGLPTIVGLSLGAFHSTALAGDGRVFSWGNNQSVQIGDGTAINRPAPTLASGLTDAVEISAGYFHTCARRTSGTLVCWGRNAYGEVGNGNSLVAPRPTAVSGITDALQISAGGFHTCARRAIGSAWCWGAGEYGQLGNGMKPISQLTPVEVILPFSPSEISTVNGTCARDSGGAVYCWGARIDQSNNTYFAATPEPMSPLSNAQRLGGSCAARPDGVSCWGFNAFGQIGDGTTTGRGSPAEVLGLVW